MPGVKAIITQDDVLTGRAVFAKDKVLYYGEPLGAIAATDPDIAEEAADLVKVEYEPLPVVQDVLESIKPDAPHLLNDRAKDGPRRRVIARQLKKLSKETGEDNSAEIEKLNAELAEFDDEIYYNIAGEAHEAAGDVEQGFAESDVVVEGTYTIPRVHQVYTWNRMCRSLMRSLPAN